MKIMFNDIKPYLRFVRYLTLDSDSNYSPSTPYDARLFFTLDGNSIIEANGIEYSMIKNSLIIINSGINYHLKSPEHSVSYLAINFDFTYAHFNQKTPISPDIVKNYDSKNLINYVTFYKVYPMSRTFSFRVIRILDSEF